MLSIRGIITVLVLAALFTYAVIWISRHDGWEGKGCGGNWLRGPRALQPPAEKRSVKARTPGAEAPGVLFRLLITRRTARRRPPPC